MNVFPRFDYFGHGRWTLWPSVALISMTPMILKHIRKMTFHAEKVSQQLEQSYGQDIIPKNLLHNPFQKTDSVSCSFAGLPLQHCIFLQKAHNGTIFFQSAGNDGRVISSSLWSRNHSNANSIGLALASFYEKLNFGAGENKPSNHIQTSFIAEFARKTGSNLLVIQTSPPKIEIFVF